MLPKAHLTSHSRMSGSSSRFLITQSWLCGSLGSFLYSSVYSFPLFLIASASVQFSSVAQSCLTLCHPVDSHTRLPCPSPCPSSRSLLKLISIESMMPSNHFIFCCPLLLLPSAFPSIRVFSNGSVLRIRWPKYWSFSFGSSSSNEYSGLISFRIDWFGLLAVQGTVKSLLQHHSFKTSILQHSTLHPYMTTGKAIALTR